MDYTNSNDTEFLELVLSGRSERFGHREHLRLAFLCAQAGETLDEVIDCCRTGIQAMARAHGAPDKYDETITAAWAARMLDVVRSLPGASFADVLARHPELDGVRRPCG